jgi:hypothetical protein
MSRRLLSRPLPLLLVLAGLLTFLIQPGELGTSDTTHRLQVAHALWTGQPQVFPSEYPEFGIHGRGGHFYAWYGIGQSLLLLPFDLLGSAASHLPLWRAYVASGTDPAIRSIVVSFSTNILVNVLSAWASFGFLGLLGFGVVECAAGTMALLVATTHLHYAQNLTENNYILLLTMTGFGLQLRWLRMESRRALFWGAGALGLNLLTRLTTGLDLLAAGCFLALLAWFERRAGGEADTGLGWRRMGRVYLATAVPLYAGFFLLDRVYQFVRFGSWTNTYVTIFGEEQRRLDPSLPANFPFNGHPFAGGFGSGVLGPLFSPHKSIFLFDPLFGLTLLLVTLLWKRLTPAVRAFFVTTLLLLAGYIAFYARYLWWAGDFSWGDRYISSAVEFAALLGVPLLLRYGAVLGRGVWRLSLMVVAASIMIQAASLAFWLPLEIYQETDWGRGALVVALRFRNIVAFALGKRGAWGLNTPSVTADPWDAAHLGAWNFLPSLLRHAGAVPWWAADLLYIGWMALGLLLFLVSVRLVRTLLSLYGTGEAAGGPNRERKVFFKNTTREFS